MLDGHKSPERLSACLCDDDYVLPTLQAANEKTAPIGAASFSIRLPA